MKFLSFVSHGLPGGGGCLYSFLLSYGIWRGVFGVIRKVGWWQRWWVAGGNPGEEGDKGVGLTYLDWGKG